MTATRAFPLYAGEGAVPPYRLFECRYRDGHGTALMERCAAITADDAMAYFHAPSPRGLDIHPADASVFEVAPIPAPVATKAHAMTDRDDYENDGLTIGADTLGYRDEAGNLIWLDGDAGKHAAPAGDRRAIGSAQELAQLYLKLVLAHQGWTLGDLARRSGVPSTTIMTIAAEEAWFEPPKYEVMAAIARASGVPVPATLIAALPPAVPAMEGITYQPSAEDLQRLDLEKRIAAAAFELNMLFGEAGRHFLPLDVSLDQAADDPTSGWEIRIVAEKVLA